jgi:hypothetical protein
VDRQTESQKFLSALGLRVASQSNTRTDAEVYLLKIGTRAYDINIERCRVWEILVYKGSCAVEVVRVKDIAQNSLVTSGIKAKVNIYIYMDVLFLFMYIFMYIDICK